MDADRKTSGSPASRVPAANDPVARIVDTPDGPAILIPTIDGQAFVIGQALERWFEIRPADAARPHPVAVEVACLCDQATWMREHGRGFRSEPDRDTPVVQYRYDSASAVAKILGISQQEMTRRCRDGEVPGSQQLTNGAWIVPHPEECNDDDRDVDNAA